jgi:hypothetical protein
MRFIRHYGFIILFTLTASMSLSTRAHLMVAQHGTINIVDDGAFLVLSLPMPAFADVDENNDCKVSMLEFNLHRAAIIEMIKQNVSLSDNAGSLPLHGIMLSPVQPHHSSEKTISQLTVMGRFTLNDPASTLNFYTGLFGKKVVNKFWKSPQRESLRIKKRFLN